MRRSERIKRKVNRNKSIKPIKKSEPKKEKANAQVSKTNNSGFYHDNYKKLLLIPFLLLIISIILIAVQTAQTGDFIKKGVSLEGGVSVTVPSETLAIDLYKSELQDKFPSHDIQIRSLQDGGNQVAVTITADITSKDTLESFIKEIQQKTDAKASDLSIEIIGSSLGETFFQQTLKALFIAFMFMGFVVFLYFGEDTQMKVYTGIGAVLAAFFMYNASLTLNIIAMILGIGLLVVYARYSIPSIAVILAAFSDIIITLAIVNLLDIKLSTAGIAAFLMLIGYSVDTDILLSTRVLKSKVGTVYDRVMSALKTGLTMNVTTFAALLIAFLFAQSETLSQIMLILIIGLFVDMINTWLQNVGILRWYFEKQEAKKA